MHRVYFSHLEVPADFARKKKKGYLGLDIKKANMKGKKNVFSLFGDLKMTRFIWCFSNPFMKEVMDHV